MDQFGRPKGRPYYIRFPLHDREAGVGAASWYSRGDPWVALDTGAPYMLFG